jgi:hypothetical protein
MQFVSTLNLDLSELFILFVKVAAVQTSEYVGYCK